MLPRVVTLSFICIVLEGKVMKEKEELKREGKEYRKEVLVNWRKEEKEELRCIYIPFMLP